MTGSPLASAQNYRDQVFVQLPHLEVLDGLNQQGEEVLEDESDEEEPLESYSDEEGEEGEEELLPGMPGGKLEGEERAYVAGGKRQGWKAGEEEEGEEEEEGGDYEEEEEEDDSYEEESEERISL